MAVYSGKDGVNTAFRLRVHGHVTQELKSRCKNTSGGAARVPLGSREKGKTSWFFIENPSHPPVFDNNNNLRYEQLPHKSNYLTRFMCCVWKELLAYKCSSQGTEAKNQIHLPETPSLKQIKHSPLQTISVGSDQRTINRIKKDVCCPTSRAGKNLPYGEGRTTELRSPAESPPPFLSGFSAVRSGETCTKWTAVSLVWDISLTKTDDATRVSKTISVF